jgi:hypothetical protein
VPKSSQISADDSDRFSEIESIERNTREKLHSYSLHFITYGKKIGENFYLVKNDTLVYSNQAIEILKKNYHVEYVAHFKMFFWINSKDNCKKSIYFRNYHYFKYEKYVL